MRNIRKITVWILTLALTIVGAFVVTPAIAYAAEPETRFDGTDVLDDLAGMTINGKAFDLEDYQFNGKGDVELLSLVEYCYSYKVNMRDNYGLYVYLYNPQGLNFSTSSVSNQIELGVAYESRVLDGSPREVVTAYEKFRLEFCSKTTDPNYLNLFYKYKVVDHVSTHDQKTILDRVKPSERRYDVSGIELIRYGASTAADYKIASTFRYTGYARGYGPSTEADALTCTSNQLDVIELDLKGRDLVYRSDMDNPEKYDHNQINAVYFSVDSRIIRDYGNLQKIKAEWWEYRTQPIVISADSEIYSRLKPWIGVEAGKYVVVDGKRVGVEQNEAVPRLGALIRFAQPNIGPWTAVFDWSYNMPYASSLDGNDAVMSESPENKLKWLFSTNGAKLEHYVVSFQDLKDAARSYTAEHSGPTLPDKPEYAAELFSTAVGEGRTAGYNLFEFDADDTFDMLEYESHPTSQWNAFLQALNLREPEASELAVDIKPIEELTIEKLRAASAGANLLMTDAEVTRLASYVEAEAQPSPEYPEGKKTYIFRHALTNYHAKQLHEYYESGPRRFTRSVNAAIVEENVFLDFDIIELTFRGEDINTVFAVVSDPIDIFSPVEVPTLPKDPLGLLQTILSLALLAVVLFVACKLVMWITKRVAELIGKSK